MHITERFPPGDLFIGERTVTVRSIPAGATINSARLRLEPVQANGISGISSDAITFGFSQTAVTGETKRRATTAEPSWVEVDFHSRRTLGDVSGANLTGTTLQIDVGGTFIDISQNGTPLASGGSGPSGTAFSVSSDSNAPLPGIRTSRVRFTAPAAAGSDPDVSALTVLHVASNVSASFPAQPPFWAQPGDVGEPVESIGFAAMLQSFISTLPPDEPHEVPIVLRSDTLARLSVIVEVEFEQTVNVLGDDLAETTLPFGHNGSAEANAEVLTVKVPQGHRVTAAGTSARVVGRFDNSKVVFGAVERLDKLAEQQAALRVASGHAAAQRLELDSDLAIDGMDLLLATSQVFTRVTVDLRADLDGKPDSASLLVQAPVLEFGSAQAATPQWFSAAIAPTLKLTAIDPGNNKPRKIWLVAQAAEGSFDWSTNAAETAADLQTSDNGGLSWRAPTALATAEPAQALIRLRQTTEQFEIPLEVEIGDPAVAERVSLERFRPLGRIDFALDGATLAQSTNAVLDRAEADACPLGEQLLNPSFDLDEAEDPDIFSPAFWTWSGRAPFLRVFGGVAELEFPRDFEGNVPAAALSQVRPVTSDCAYQLSVFALASGIDARVELIWRTGACDVDRVDTVAIPVPTPGSNGNSTLRPVELRATAPTSATQVEVRFFAPVNVQLNLRNAALIASPQAISNSSLARLDDNNRPVGWTVSPSLDSGFQPLISETNNRVTIRNETGLLDPVTLSQRFDAAAGNQFTVSLIGAGTRIDGAREDPALVLEWFDAGERVLEPREQRALGADSADHQVLTGLVPADAASGEVRLLLPDRTALTVERIEAVQLSISEVPISLLSAAPGQATIDDFTIAFEPLTQEPQVIPASGLCLPTPADRTPGDVCEIDPKTCKPRDYESAPEAVPPGPIEPPPATGTPVTDRPPSTGLPPPAGVPVTEVPAIDRPATATTSATAVPALSNRPATAGLLISRLPAGVSVVTPTFAPPAALPPVEALAGIGEVRGEMLREMGIRDVRDFAQLSSADIVSNLNIHQELARNLVLEARSMLGRPTGGGVDGRG